MPVLVVRVYDGSKRGQDSRHVKSKLVATVPENNIIEEGEQHQKHEVDVSETVINWFPAEAVEEVPFLQFPIDVPIDDLFPLDLGQFTKDHAIFSYNASFHVNFFVNRAVLCILKMAEFFVPFVKKTKRSGFVKDSTDSLTLQPFRS